MVNSKNVLSLNEVFKSEKIMKILTISIENVFISCIMIEINKI